MVPLSFKRITFLVHYLTSTVQHTVYKKIHHHRPHSVRTNLIKAQAFLQVEPFILELYSLISFSVFHSSMFSKVPVSLMLFIKCLKGLCHEISSSGFEPDAFIKCLKGLCHEISSSGFFHESVSPKHLSVPLRPCISNISKIRGHIRG